MAGMTQFRIRQAESHADIAIVRSLFLEYEGTLGINLCFQGFEKELADLPGAYAPPDGALLIAETIDAMVAGCVAMRPLEDHACEMKRLYVKPEFRKAGLGDLLVQKIVQASGQHGYGTIRLDTLPSMESAIRLYERFGFRDIPPYRLNPVAGTRYMALDLGGRDKRSQETR